jgi:hypothetical protein
MLAIDGQLPEAGGVDELVRHSFKWLRIGILINSGVQRASLSRD